MAREIKLNSSDWCDLVFEGKNKSYGAYALRQSSTKRHISAFVIIVLFVGSVAVLPSFLNMVKAANQDLGGINTPVTLSELEIEKKVEEPDVIRQELAPPPVETRAAIQFTPPVIVETVDESREMRTQEELNSNPNIQISIVDNLDGSTSRDAVAPEELREHRAVVQEEPQKPFITVEQMPRFPGGDTELMKFLANNLKYPAVAAENDIQGRVVIRFVVGKDGSVSDITVLRPLDPSCDREAVRVIKSMPKWIAGMQNGRNVPVYYTLPVLFKLQK